MPHLHLPANCYDTSSKLVRDSISFFPYPVGLAPLADPDDLRDSDAIPYSSYSIYRFTHDFSSDLDPKE